MGDQTQKDKLKQDIFLKIEEYYKLIHEPKSFTPGESRVPYSGRVFDSREMINLVDSALDFWLTSGPYGNKLEKEFKDYFGCNDFFLVNSGSSANLIVVSALVSQQLKERLKPGDEIITPAVTFPTTLAPIIQNGLVPVFVDCEIGTYNINAALIEDAVSDKTRAVFVPHTLGNPCDMDVIMSIAKKYNLFVLEDVCDALGAVYDGMKVGTFGDLASLSFFPAHHITMGEGGGVVINNNSLRKIAKSIRDWGRDCWCEPGQNNACGKRFEWKLGKLPHGYDHKYIYSNIGYNLKVTDMQAAIGLEQMRKLDLFIEKRNGNFKTLYAGLQKYSGFLELPKSCEKAEPSWFGFPITVMGGVNRLELVKWLEASKIETRLVFGGNILRQPGFSNFPHRIHGALDETDRVMNDTFFIGVYPGLTEAMINFVISRFDEFFKSKGLV